MKLFKLNLYIISSLINFYSFAYNFSTNFAPAGIIFNNGNFMAYGSACVNTESGYKIINHILISSNAFSWTEASFSESETSQIFFNCL